MSGVTWRKDAMPQDGTVIYRRTWSIYRYQPYKPNSQQFKRGEKGRWQEMNEYGSWENCNHPLGDEWVTEAEFNSTLSPHKPTNLP